MADLLVTGGTVLTMNDRRDVHRDGAVAIEGDRILDVGPRDAVRDRHVADRVIDAAGHAVLPGFVTPHTHVSDILLRGIGTDRQLYDWLYNVKIPGTAAMTAEEHAIASALFTLEAVRSGLLTFVEFGVGGEAGYGDDVIAAKLETYDAAGVRNVYAHSFVDRAPADAFVDYLGGLAAKEPGIERPDAGTQDTDAALEGTRALIERYHGTADGRQGVWPAPLRAFATTPAGLRGAAEIAEAYDVMATTHVAEAPEQEHRINSGIDHLRNGDFLGDRTVLAHCVQLSARDVRLLAATDTRVSHNVLTNLGLGDGIAPVPSLQRAGVTVGIGTDNPSVSGTMNVVRHLQAAATVHKGVSGDAGAITAERALEMATIDGARAIGRADDLGSLEAGKLADLVLLDLDRDHLTPHPNVPAAIVYGATGTEVTTAICNGEVVMADRRVPGIQDRYPSLRADARRAAAAVTERVGLDSLRDRPWTGRSPD